MQNREGCMERLGKKYIHKGTMVLNELAWSMAFQRFTTARVEGYSSSTKSDIP
jgi:hypothetical protein